jgi:hypothetical protein
MEGVATQPANGLSEVCTRYREPPAERFCTNQGYFHSYIDQQTDSSHPKRQHVHPIPSKNSNHTHESSQYSH